MSATTADSITRARLEAVNDDEVVLSLPHTDYRLNLKLDGALKTPIGKRVKGVIRAKALRIHATSGGGRFIEPVWGAPRIVTGMVLAIDPEQNAVLVDVATPMWVTAPENQDFSEIAQGELATFYVESEATFTPEEG